MSLPGALGVLQEVLLLVLVASGSAPVLLLGFIVLLGTFSASRFSSFKSAGCRVADLKEEVTDWIHHMYMCIHKNDKACAVIFVDYIAIFSTNIVNLSTNIGEISQDNQQISSPQT